MKFIDRRRYKPDLIEIEHDEPFVLSRTTSGEWFRLLGDLQVGDSFFIPAPTFRDVESVRSTVWDAVRRSGLPIRIVTRRVEDGVRVWRMPEDYTGKFITGDLEYLRAKK